jgi:hypothetical protein
LRQCHVYFHIFACCVVRRGLRNGMVEWAEVGFADCVCKSHALRSGLGRQQLQCCGHLQRDVWNLEHGSSQCSAIGSCSHIAAECRSRDLRWWLLYVLPCLFSYLSSLRVVLCGLLNGMVEWVGVALLIACASLMPCAVGSNVPSNAVDIFNVTSGAWSTAALSVARYYLAATSLPNVGVAIFAGGYCTCCHVYFCIFACCAAAGWGMGWLSGRRLGLLIACASLMPCAVGSGPSNAVDIFNVTSGAWSTAALSVAQYCLAATSLPKVGVAIFAGGAGTYCHVYFRIFACCVVRVGEWDG